MPFVETLNPYVAKIKMHSHVATELDRIWPAFESQSCMVDLGCGNGHFLQESLQSRPDWLGLGVERRYKRVFKTAEKLSQTKSRVLQIEIDKFLAASPSDFWNEVWLQFPDPWPKLKHEKHRGVKLDVFTSIHRILKPGGRFFFRSDSRPYWHYLQTLNREIGLFSHELAAAFDHLQSYPSSLYQKKFVSRGIKIYSLEFRK